jgi:hypothetical protein
LLRVKFMDRSGLPRIAQLLLRAADSSFGSKQQLLGFENGIGI